MAVHRDAAGAVERDPEVLHAQVGRVGDAAGGNEHLLRHLRGFLLRLVVLPRELDAARDLLHVDHLAVQVEGEALFLQDLLEFRRHLRVGGAHDLVQKLDHVHLGAEAGPHAAELEPDHAAADHGERLRHGAELERAGGGDDVLLVDEFFGEPGQSRDLATNRDHDVVRLDVLLGAVRVGDLDQVRALEEARPRDVLDLVRLEEAGDPAGEPRNGLLLLLHQRRDVHLQGAVQLDALLFEGVRGVVVHVGGVQQGLRRNAPHIQTGAPERAALLHAGGGEPQLRSLDRTHIPARTTADHHHVELLREKSGRPVKHLARSEEPRDLRSDARELPGPSIEKRSYRSRRGCSRIEGRCK
mmetsp:Transcript_15207/g.37808  ORF Transcript_15207/g.37808 Transcript_15207/m.37808 type:complete len:356 (-) Transcript_15207:331-1398(-)